MSSLNVKPTITIEEGLQAYDTKMNAALSALSQKGFAPLAPPTYVTQAGQMPYRGELPADLTTLTDDQLGYYMGLLSEWNAYVQFQLAEADSALSKAKSDMALVEASLRIAYRTDEEGKKRSNPERDDYVGTDRRFVEVRGNVLYWETIWRYIKAIAFSAEQSFSAVSRRITQRGQEIERERRNQGVSGGVNIPPPNGPVFGRR